jgi:hypothetical protein
MWRHQQGHQQWNSSDGNNWQVYLGVCLHAAGCGCSVAAAAGMG